MIKLNLSGRMIGGHDTPYKYVPCPKCGGSK